MYFAQSLNGFIAKETGAESFVSGPSWKRFVRAARSCQCLVVGRVTYDLLAPYRREFRGVKIIAVSGVLDKVVHTSNVKPDIISAVRFLQDSGYDKILIGGGSRLFADALKNDIVDEVWVDMMPTIIGTGIPAFYPQD
jgi:dihydrofolate reductase